MTSYAFAPFAALQNDEEKITQKVTTWVTDLGTFQCLFFWLMLNI